MHTAIDDRRTAERTDRIADLMLDAAYLIMLFSGAVMVVAIAVAFFV